MWFFHVIAASETIVIGLLLGIIGNAKRRDSRIEIDVDETDFR